MTKLLNDSIAEEIVLSGIMQYGSDILIDTEDVLHTEDFFDKTNQQLYHVLKFLFHTNDIDNFDVPTIMSCMSKQFKYSIDRELLDSLSNQHVNKDNILKSAIVVSKLSIARKLCLCLKQTREHLLGLTGHEKIDDIIKDTEDPIFQITSNVNNNQNDLVDITEGYEEIIEDIISKPKDIVGLPTGFDQWDQLIGGGLRPGSVNVLAARTKVGKCIDYYNTVLSTNIGILMPYELFNIENGHKQNRTDLKLLNRYGKLITPSYFWNNGFGATIKLTTKYGSELQGTKNHPIKILHKDGKIKWKNFDELEVGDYTVQRRGDNCWGKKTFDLEEAYVLGLLVGDGCINEKIVSLSNIHETPRKYFTKYIKKIGGYIGSENERELRCCLVKLAKYVNDYGFYYKEKDNKKYKIFPKHIRQCTENVVCQAMSGYYDADGGVQKNGISITTNSEKLMLQTRSVLLNLGILPNTRVRKIIMDGWDEPRTYWETNIHNIESIEIFVKKIGFRIKYKQDAANKLLNKKSCTKNDTIPNISDQLLEFKNMLVKNNVCVYKGNNSIYDLLNMWIRKVRKPSRFAIKRLLSLYSKYSRTQEYQFLEEIINPKLLFDKIVKLDESKCMTCDFYIPEDHSFIANGFVNHNSYFSLNVTYNMAQKDIPVLYLDTELTRRYQMMRLIALHTKIPISEIETGLFSKDKDKLKLVKDSYDVLSKYPITHCDISGQSINNILSIARRWLVRKVGFTNQKANKCLIVYDYIKLMDVADVSGALKEYQLLGFLLSSIHDFSTKYELPVFATVQLNRDHDIAQSDRIEWLCSTMTLLKDKLPEDLAEDNIMNGDKKLIIKHTRFGQGLDQCDYINMKTNLGVSSIKEGMIHSQVVSFKGNEQSEE